MAKRPLGPMAGTLSTDSSRICRWVSLNLSPRRLEAAPGCVATSCSIPTPRPFRRNIASLVWRVVAPAPQHNLPLLAATDPDRPPHPGRTFLAKHRHKRKNQERQRGCRAHTPDEAILACGDRIVRKPCAASILWKISADVHARRNIIATFLVRYDLLAELLGGAQPSMSSGIPCP